jgi:hypothetical protein
MKLLKIFKKFLFTLFVIFFTTAATFAGDLRSNPKQSKCDYLFSGVVVRGDAQKIVSQIPSWSSGSTLCLDSPGGSLTEGIKMFHAIWENGSLATRVLQGAECQSACALAFLGGSLVVGTGVIRSKNAVIEAGATLGFHSPRLVLPRDGIHSSADVAGAYQIALIDAHAMFDLTQTQEQSARGMSEFLFSKILMTPPQDMYRINTIGRASLSDVQVANVPIKELSWDALMNVCNTAFLKADSTEKTWLNEKLSFESFSDNGIDGSGDIILKNDRVWSWSDDWFMNFMIRGYPASHVNESFCKIRLSKLAYNRERNLPIADRDPTTHYFEISIWVDAYVPTGSGFADYAVSYKKGYERVYLPWVSLWHPDKPLSDF